MNSLTIQILILIASFLFYRVLRSGFDSWTAVLVDFGIVLFLFGLQYFLQKKNTPFPSGEMSRFFGVSFPEKLFLEKGQEQGQGQGQRREQGQGQRNLIFLEIKDDFHIQPNQKISIPSDISLSTSNLSAENSIKIPKSGVYMVQVTMSLDKIPFSAKFSIIGQKNNIVKSVHDGENSFIVSINEDEDIHFEIENSTKPCMILGQSTIYLVEL
jgi:hypothetical protein